MKEFKLNKHNFYLVLASITAEEFENLLNILEKNGKNVNVPRSWEYDSWEYLYLNIFDTDEVILANTLSGDKIKATYQQILDMFTPELKIGEKFEFKGFICQVIEEIDRGKWYKVSTKRKVFFEKMTKKKVNSFCDANIEEIIDQAFIKQLERYAK